MENLTFFVREWILSLSVFFVTILLVTAARITLKKLNKNQGWNALENVLLSLFNLLYILGFKVFSHLAPVHGKMVTWVEGTLSVLSIMIFVNLFQKLAFLGIEWGASRVQNSEVLHRGFVPLLRNLTTIFVFILAGIMILKYFSYDVMSFVTAMGISSLAVGLAAKDILSHMISGFILIIDRNLRPGDRINLMNSIGDVIEIGLRSTQIKMPNGSILIVPNSELVNTRILNLSITSKETTCSTIIRISLSVPFSKVDHICISVIKSLDHVVQEKPYGINLVSLSDGQKLIKIEFWIKDMNNSGVVLTQFLERLAERFQQENISLLSPVALTSSRHE